MEKAVEELQYTITKAKEYIAEEEQYADIVSSHVRALDQDIRLVEKSRTSDKDLEQLATQVTIEARRLSREMERQAYTLTRKEKENCELQKKALEVVLGIEQSSTSAIRAEKRTSRVKIPQIKLPIFDGEVQDYRGFMNVFLDTINNEPDITSVQKWLLLKEHLSGKALRMVRTLPTAPETYEVARQLLEEMFGSKRKAVAHLYQKLQLLQNANMTDDSLQIVQAQMEGILRSLEQLEENVNGNDFLRAVAISKYPDELTHLLKVYDDMSLQQFREELAKYIRGRETTIRQVRSVKASLDIDSSPVMKEADQKLNKSKAKSGGVATQPQGESTISEKENFTGTSSAKSKKPFKKFFSKPPKCVFCSSNHYSDECDIYTTLEQRLKKVADKCIRCLRIKHPTTECARTFKCAHCGEQTHTRSLCPTKFGTAGSLVALIDNEAAVQCNFLTLMLQVSGGDKKVTAKVRAAIDTMSKPTLITKRLAEFLKIKQKPGQVRKLIGLAGVPLNEKDITVGKLCLHPPDASPICIEVLIVEKIAEKIVATSPTEFKKQYPQFQNLMMPDEGNDREIDILIGTSAIVSILTLQNSIYVNKNLQLLSTKFGWLPFGSLNIEKDTQQTITNMVLSSYDPIKMMTELETIGLKEFEQIKNEEEQIALDKFYKTIKFIDGRYQVAWPWKYEPPEIFDNFGLAYGRLQSLYKKLKTSPNLLKEYDKLIMEQVEHGIIEPVHKNSSNSNDLKHYIAHQAVIKLEKSTPLRIVYDASARQGKGTKSLNDNILKGTSWVDNIPALLTKFRCYPTAVTADIEKAFHQISIRPEDRDVVRFLWLRDPTKPPSRENLQIYRFTRMAFGIIASPFLLYATIRFHLKNHPHEYTDMIDANLYADNLVLSLRSSVDLLDFYNKTKNSFSSMGMNLTKWVTNNKKFQALIPNEDRQQGSNQSVLGIRWDTGKDWLGLQYQANMFQTTNLVTKRTVLRETAAVFDPLGWAAPVTLVPRLFIRRLWQKTYEWDQPLEKQLNEEWQKIRSQLKEVSRIELPRMMIRGVPIDERPQLHLFVDASVEAYAAVVFLKIKNQTAMVASKSRLAPKNKLSVPRLELLAAVVGIRFATSICDTLKSECTPVIYFWGDSKCVLSWIKSEKMLPAYINKSIMEIKNSKVKFYNYVPSAMNPADIATRGASVQQLLNENWWGGPSWLKNESQWPPQTRIPENELGNQEMHNANNRNENLIMTLQSVSANKIDLTIEDNTPFNILPKRFSNLSHLLRRTARMVFVLNTIFLKRINKKVFDINNEKTNYNLAKKMWIKWDQRRAYKLIEIKRISNVSYLRNIKVFYDSEGIVRCHTRLANSKINEETITPILLVKGSSFTELIVLHTHVAQFHAGTSHTLAALRKSYWIPHGRRVVYYIIHNRCLVCKKYAAQPFESPDIAPLPEIRVANREAPFCHIGLDIFGPYRVYKQMEQERTSKKLWIVIFTCLVIRAVHLETIMDMTAEEFLQAFRRFVGRRGVPQTVISDNAPQFHVIEGIFRSLWHTLSENQQVAKYFATQQITWKFIPAYAPFMGGAYERLIKTIKNAMEKTYPYTNFTKKQFCTIVVELEAMMNARPITYVDRSITTPLLTPNHFLMATYPAMPVKFREDETFNPIAQLWKAAEKFLDIFWKRWAEDYLLALRERRDLMKNPHLTTIREPKVGEIVLMLDPTMKRSSWRKAIIERLIPSQDGKIRAVQIKISNGGRMIRPIVKLVPLELIADVSQATRQILNKDNTGLVFQGVEGSEESLSVRA